MTTSILTGDAKQILPSLPDRSVQMCVTSPPYYRLRDYGMAGQIGLEPTPEAYVASLVSVFREVRRVMADDGTLWLNLGDSYSASPKGNMNGQDKSGLTSTRTQEASPVGVRKDHLPGLKPKDLIGIPWRVAFALQADGWYLRSDIIWHKPNPMPESVTDRPTKAHEYLFLLAKSERYFYNAEAISEDTVGPDEANDFVRPERLSQPNGSSIPYQSSGKRNKRTVWTLATQPYSGAHFATFPPALIEPCILAGSRPGDTVLDPFGGAGTTGLVADRLGRNAILVELNPSYATLATNRITDDCPLFVSVSQ